MASDITRKTFTPRKHYSGVLMQQGRVQLDADWNEQLDIEQYHTHTESTDVIGQSGAPRAVNDGNSFKITIPTSGTDIQIDWGRIYVEGLLCELEQPTTYLTQPQYPLPDTSMFIPLTGSPPSPPNAGRLSNGTYIAYLDAWQREVNYLDDPQIQEVALGGADTAIRLQTAWQVKLLRVSTNLNNADNCSTTVYPAWTTLTQAPSGKLNVQTKQVSATQDPCLLPPSAGFRRVENQLYRVEVHRGGTLDQTTQITFKWSRDNATVETIIEKVQGGVLTVASTGKDEVLNFAVGHWVEVVDDLSDLNQNPQRLYQITDVKHETRQITLDVANLARAGVGKMKLRRWDQSGAAATMNGMVASDAWLDLEDGIQVQFSAGTYQTGDYWLVPARTATGSIEWPQVGSAFQPQSPIGVHHVFARLALLKANNGTVTVADCRKVFRPLTNLHASDIYYDKSGCLGSLATTVQEALDILCRRNGSACTLIAQPGPGWESVFSQILPGQSAQICFLVGEYPLSTTSIINGKGHLKLIGAGKGTKIIAPLVESALAFDGCSSVLIRDLHIQTGDEKRISREQSRHLNGSINLKNCLEVHLDSIALQCGMSKKRDATCLTVHDAKLVRVLNCDFKIGHLQQGMLLVNAEQVFIENNTFDTYPKPEEFNFVALLEDYQMLAGIRNYFAADIIISDEEVRGHSVNYFIQNNKYKKIISFNTPYFVDFSESILEIFSSYIEEGLAKMDSVSNKKIVNLVKNFVKRIFIDQIFRNNFNRIQEYFNTLNGQNEAVSSQSITIGGILANNINISKNVIKNTLQGIRIGTSKSGQRDVSFATMSAYITNNSIDLILPGYVHSFERYGIFIGNADDVIIENNKITLKCLDFAREIPVEGIRIWGKLGFRGVIAKNYINMLDSSIAFGIRARSLGAKNSSNPLSKWLFTNNLILTRMKIKYIDLIWNDGIFVNSDNFH
jgi:hypothetical protein